MKIGIIGAGAIAQFLIEQLTQHASFQVTAVYVRDATKYHRWAQAHQVALFTNIDDFLCSDIDVVVEAATIEAVEQLVPTVLAHKPVVLISVGALANDEPMSQLLQCQHTLHLPSGAIGGLDLLQNAHVLGTVTTVELTTSKPAQSLLAQPIETAQTIFLGSANEAIARYPKNMNVSIVLALAGIGFKQTTVRLIADPHITQNIHHINIAGDFGEASITIKNNPLPQNPKTSYLAAMSIIGTLQRLQQQFIIGA